MPSLSQTASRLQTLARPVADLTRERRAVRRAALWPRCERGGSSIAPFPTLSVIVAKSSGRYGAAMTDEDDDEDFEPLEVVPVAVPIRAHDEDVGRPSVVRLFFRGGACD